MHSTGTVPFLIAVLGIPNQASAKSNRVDVNAGLRRGCLGQTYCLRIRKTGEDLL